MSNSAIYLSIADFTIELRSSDESTIRLDQGFDHFYAESDQQLKPDVVLNCFGSIPAELKNPAKSCYKAEAGNDLLWEIFDYPNGLQFMIYNPDNLGELQQIALFNESNQSWKIYSEQENSIIYPLQYPLAPLVLYYLILHKDAIMIHASGVYDGKEGRIFSGFSGVGKSTMAGLWNQKDSMVINDDRLILRKLNDGYWMYNTPMHYTDERRKTPLNRVYLPYHHPENKFEPITGVQAVAEMMAFCIQHGYRSENTSAHFAFISELTQKLPVVKLGVVPTTEVVDFIRANDAK